MKKKIVKRRMNKQRKMCIYKGIVNILFVGFRPHPLICNILKDQGMREEGAN